MAFTITPLGDQAVLIEVGLDIHPFNQQKVQDITSLLDTKSPYWMIEYIPAFTTITIFYDPMKIVSNHRHMLPFDVVCMELNTLIHNNMSKSTSSSRLIEIPVLYGDIYGPDLEYVAEYNQLTPEEVIKIHTSTEYLVYMIGFAPGFPYLGGMNKSIATPRRKLPRLSIPAQSVGIAGEQTGIYPIETPGGWQIIGRTPLSLFLPKQSPPTLLKAGDRIVFKSVSLIEFSERNVQHQC